MGMMPTIVQSWHEASEAAMHHQTIASRRAAIVSAVSKWARMVIQIAIMTAAAWQMIQPGSTMSPGVMMAAVILVGRALMPLERIGRASCRESVCQYVESSVVAVSLKKKNKK